MRLTSTSKDMYLAESKLSISQLGLQDMSNDCVDPHKIAIKSTTGGSQMHWKN